VREAVRGDARAPSQGRGIAGQQRVHDRVTSDRSIGKRFCRSFPICLDRKIVKFRKEAATTLVETMQMRRLPIAEDSRFPELFSDDMEERAVARNLFLFVEEVIFEMKWMEEPGATEVDEPEDGLHCVDLDPDSAEDEEGYVDRYSVESSGIYGDWQLVLRETRKRPFLYSPVFSFDTIDGDLDGLRRYLQNVHGELKHSSDRKS
jgi:hypothetical protein